MSGSPETLDTGALPVYGVPMNTPQPTPKTNPLNLVAHGGSPSLGTITYWSTVAAPISDLRDAWEDAKLRGPTGTLSRPCPPCQATALRLACDQIADGRNTIVRRHPSGQGVVLIHETPADEADQDPTYTPKLHVWLDHGVARFSDGAHPLARAITAKYEQLRETLTAKEAGSWLATVVRELHGVALRAHGGVYFVPADSVATWDRVAQLVQEHAGVTVYQIPAHRTQGDTLPAVLAAAQAELATAVEVLARESEGDLGDRARDTRKGRLAQLSSQVEMYEDLCGCALTEIRGAMRRVDELLAVTALSGPMFAGLEGPQPLAAPVPMEMVALAVRGLSGARR